MVRRPGTGTQNLEFVQAVLEVVKFVFKLIQRNPEDQIIKRNPRRKRCLGVAYVLYADIFKLRVTGFYNFLNPLIALVQRRIIDASLL